MNQYLLDTNHLSAYLKRQPVIESRIRAALDRGDRCGITLPILCEYRAGLAMGKRSQRNLARLKDARAYLRLWPLDEKTAIEFGRVAGELRQIGRPIGQFDTLIAASARQLDLILLTADTDFNAVPRLKIENWLA